MKMKYGVYGDLSIIYPKHIVKGTIPFEVTVTDFATLMNNRTGTRHANSACHSRS